MERDSGGDATLTPGSNPHQAGTKATLMRWARTRAGPRRRARQGAALPAAPAVPAASRRPEEPRCVVRVMTARAVTERMFYGAPNLPIYLTAHSPRVKPSNILPPYSRPALSPPCVSATVSSSLDEHSGVGPPTAWTTARDATLSPMQQQPLGHAHAGLRGDRCRAKEEAALGGRPEETRCVVRKMPWKTPAWSHRA